MLSTARRLDPNKDIKTHRSDELAVEKPSEQKRPSSMQEGGSSMESMIGETEKCGTVEDKLLSE